MRAGRKATGSKAALQSASKPLNALGSMTTKKRAKKGSTKASFQRDPKIEDRILNAAVKCFRMFGMGKTSMEDIASASKVSRSIVYRYFPTRHHLAVEVLRREVGDHTQLLLPIFQDHPYPPDAMVEGIVSATASARKHPYTSIIVSDAGADLLSRVPNGRNPLLAAMSEQWMPVFTEWKRDGYIRSEVDLEDLVLTITTQMHSYLGKAFADTSEERIRRIVRTLIVPAVFDFSCLRRKFQKG